MAEFGVGAIHTLRGDHAEAIGPLERGLVITNASAFPLTFPFIAAPLGLAYVILGRQADGLRLLEEAVQSAESMELMANHTLRLVWLGQAHVAAGDGEAAGRFGRRALDVARRYKERGHEAYALRLLGDLALSSSPPDAVQAREHYGQALELAESLGMRPLSAHCHLGLARTEGAIQDRDGEPHAERATALYQELGMTAWVQRAEEAPTSLPEPR